MIGIQRALSLIFPDQCLLCAEYVAERGGLCAICWRGLDFIRGTSCHACGTPLPGEDHATEVFCDDCMRIERPWELGRSAMTYGGSSRRLILALKHADRPELALHAARWLEASSGDCLSANTLLVPVPIHWSRLVRRRYNQSAELVRALAHRTGLDVLPDALVRNRSTAKQDGMSVEERFANVAGAIRPHPRRGPGMAGREICLVDDVMTSGATLVEATNACYAAGAVRVSVLVLARVVKPH